MHARNCSAVDAVMEQKNINVAVVEKTSSKSAHPENGIIWSNSFEVLASDASKCNIPEKSSVVNLENGSTLYVDLKLDADSQTPQPLSLPVKTPEEHNNSQDSQSSISKESGRVLFGTKDKNADVTKLVASHSIRDMTNASSATISTSDKVSNSQSKSKDRKTDGKLSDRETNRSTTRSAEIVHHDASLSDLSGVEVSNKGRIDGKENPADEWIYEPPPLPPPFGYQDWKTNKYKIKGQLVDTPYGKIIYFRNSKVRSLKSFLQEFQIKQEDLIFMDA